MIYFLSYSRKHPGKRGESWLPAFSPFPTMFLKGFLYRVMKSPKCGKELHVIQTSCVCETLLNAAAIVIFFFFFEKYDLIFDLGLDR